MRNAGSGLRVLIVEDHPIFRHALAQALSLDKDIEVVASCGALQEALDRIRRDPVDVIISDLGWRGDPYAGLRFICRALTLAPEAKVIVCSQHDDDESVRQAIQAGVGGYLLKDEVDAADVVQAVKDVRRNVPAYSPTVIQIMARLVRQAEASERAAALHPLGALTAREREVLPLLADGLSNAEIGQRLNIAEKTVKTHVSRILHKLDLSSRYQVAGYLDRQGMRPSRRPGRQSKA